MKNASSWDNGSPDYKTGAGLGLRIDSNYQSSIFNQKLNTIIIYHNNNLVAQNVNVSNKICQKLIDKNIGLWLIHNNWHLWLTGHPHRFTITRVGYTNRFDIV